MFGTTVVDRFGHEKVLRIDVKIPEKFLVRCYAAAENNFSSGAVSRRKQNLPIQEEFV